jgi:hypothetical protein
LRGFDSLKVLVEQIFLLGAEQKSTCMRTADKGPNKQALESIE